MGKTEEWLTVGPGRSRTVKVFGLLAIHHIHWDSKNGSFRRTFCPGPGCFRCAGGDRRQTQHILGVIDREDGRPKLMPVGNQVVHELEKSVEFGNPDRMEFTVSRKRDRFGGYEVISRKSKPLLKAEMALIIDFLADLAGKALSQDQE